MLVRFGIDHRGLWTGQPDGQPDLALSPLSYRDEWGVTYRKAHANGEYITDTSPLQHIDERILADVGDAFQRGEVFVPELLVAARAMKGAMAVLEPLLVDAG